MIKIILSVFILIFSISVAAQSPNREDLERQKQQLKKELDQTQKMLNDNKTRYKENFTQLVLINNKVQLQDKIIENINNDINILDNNLYSTQREINRYDRLLDTLKQEYGKSMVYAYKNRSNYDFLNFIFSSGNFNDAIKRIEYLKSYRNYREMQGENILRTQVLRRKRVEELTGIKQKKSTVLHSKDEEMNTLELQQKEKDEVVGQLQKQGKELNNKIAATKKQYLKVNAAIASALKKAIEDARKKAMEETAKRIANEKALKLAADRAAAEKKAADAKALADAKKFVDNNKSNNPVKTTAVISTTKPSEPIVKIPVKEKVVKKDESVLVTPENVVLNSNFINNKGSLPWPVEHPIILLHNGRNQLQSGIIMDVTGISIGTDIGSSVKSVFTGTVYKVMNVDDIWVVMIQHGKYFSTYSNLESTNVHSGQSVTTGQVIGRAAANIDGQGAVIFDILDEKNNYDPERWLRRR